MRKKYHLFKTCIVGLLFICSINAFGGAPSWSRVDYTNSTIFIGVVGVNNPWTQSFTYKPVAGDYVGAFVGNECRMIAKIFTFDNKLYVSSVIQGGDTCVGDPGCTSAGKETVTFRLWSDAGNVEYPGIKGDTITNPGGSIDNAIPYVIGRPKSGKDLLSLTIANTTINPVFSSSVNSYTASAASIPAVGAYTFTSSSKSTVVVQNATNLSGSAAERTTTITVTAEDGSTKNYTIVFGSACNLTTAPTLSASVSSVCQGKDALLSASGMGTTTIWYSDAAGANQLSVGTSYTVSPTATTVYYAKQSNDVCSSPMASVTITVNQKPTVTLSASLSSVCAGVATTLTAGGAVSYSWSNSLSAGISNTVTPQATTTYVVTGTDANGCNNTATTTITLKDAPGVPVATGATVCQGQTASISAVGTEIKWYDAAGVSYANGSPVNVSAAGSYYATQTVNGCESPKAVAIVVINQKPAAIAVESKTINFGDQVPTFTATQIVNWFDSNGGSLGTNTSFTPNVPNNVAQSYTYKVNVSSGTCSSDYTTFSLTVKSQDCPSAPSVVVPSKVCQGDNATLTTTGASPKWYDVPTGGTAISTSSSYITTVAGNYYVSQTTNGCESSRALAQLVINQKPVVRITVPPSMKTTDPAFLVTVSPVGGTLTGSNIIGGTKFDPSLTPAGNQTVTYTYTDQATGCSATVQEIFVTTKTLDCPPAPTVAAPKACQGSSVTISAIGTDLKWYMESTGGSPFQVATNSYSTAIAGNYYVSQTLNGCESPRAMAQVAFNPLPSVQVTLPATIKTTDAPVAIVVSPAGGQLSGDNVVGSNFIPGSTPGFKIVTYSYTDPTTTCSAKASASIEVIKSLDCPSAPVVVAPKGCNGESVSIKAYGTDLKWYNDQTGGTPVQTALDTYVTTENKTLYVSQTANGCESSRTLAQVVFNAKPVVTVTLPVATIKTTDSPVEVTVSPVGGSLTGTNIVGTKFNPSGSISEKVVNYSYTDPSTGCSAAKQITIQVTDGNIITDIVPTDIVFTTSTIQQSINVGDIKVLEYKIFPSNVTKTPELVWSSSDESIIYVDNKGSILAIKKGLAIVSVYVKSNPNVKASIVINSISTSVDIVSNEVKVHPSIASDYIMISNAANVSNIKVHNIVGNVVSAEVAHDDNAYVIDVRSLAAGVYYVVIERKNASTVTESFIKNK